MPDAASKRKRRKPRRAVELGVSDDEYNRLLEAQGGGCALCGELPKRTRKDGTPYKLHVDHNHRTGRIRGLLCFRCNRALPTYATSEWLERARVYVYADEYGMSGDIPDQWAEAR